MSSVNSYWPSDLYGVQCGLIYYYFLQSKHKKERQHEECDNYDKRGGGKKIIYLCFKMRPNAPGKVYK